MDPTQFETLTAGTTKQYDVNCRQVSNGFALAGNVRYVNDQGNVVYAQTTEAVATDTTGAATALAGFLANGKFA